MGLIKNLWRSEKKELMAKNDKLILTLDERFEDISQELLRTFGYAEKKEKFDNLKAQNNKKNNVTELKSIHRKLEEICKGTENMIEEMLSNTDKIIIAGENIDRGAVKEPIEIPEYNKNMMAFQKNNLEIIRDFQKNSEKMKRLIKLNEFITEHPFFDTIKNVAFSEDKVHDAEAVVTEVLESLRKDFKRDKKESYEKVLNYEKENKMTLREAVREWKKLKSEVGTEINITKYAFNHVYADCHLAAGMRSTINDMSKTNPIGVNIGSIKQK
ncbi:MAG: hypothetical protein K5769_06800 [Pseudobutyrivibrio sp.]|nr:hypothetical protein [Pseudobutyrivibrio sp.]